MVFDPTITTKDDLSECFRVFTDPQRLTRLPAQRLWDPRTNLRHELLTDGSCTNNGKENACCSAGVWFQINDPCNAAIRAPSTEQSIQIGELTAVIEALNRSPTFHPLEIISDSKYVIEGLTEHLRNWEDKGWIGIKNVSMFKLAAYLLKRRSATMTFTWVKGHEGALGNEESDRLAKGGVEKDTPLPTILQIPREFDLQSAKLSAIDQATAYQGIQERQHKDLHQNVITNLSAAKRAVGRINSTQETDATIWKDLRKLVLCLHVQQFLYKTIHNACMISDRWTRIPKYALRGICSICGVTESMQHILLESTHTACPLIWNLVKDLWPHNYPEWPDITIGMILGAGSVSLPDRRRPGQTGPSPLSLKS